MLKYTTPNSLKEMNNLNILKKMELQYTARSIAEIENEAKKPITDVVGDYSMKTIVLLVKKGLGMGKSDDDAYNVIETFLKENEMTELYLQILERLQGGGFLPRALKIEDIRNKMQNLQV